MGFDINSVLFKELVVSHFSVASLAKSSLEKLRGITKTRLLPERSSKSRLPLNSPSSFLVKWVFVDFLMSVSP